MIPADHLKAVYPPNENLMANSYVNSMEKYREMYQESIENPTAFWSRIAEDFFWKDPLPQNPAQFMTSNFDVTRGPICIEWMKGASTNICYNALDHIIRTKDMGGSIAFYWEGNDPSDSGTITYQELLTEVCKFANVLKSLGIAKGDRVAIYMPMVAELVIAMLACARIGAVHSIVFGGFSGESLADRIMDSKCSLLISADGVFRGKKAVHLKEIADEALDICSKAGHGVKKNIVLRHLPRVSTASIVEVGVDSVNVPWNDSRDIAWEEIMRDASPDCNPEWVDAEHPLFMLYTSGSTGKPKGVVHTTGGYMLYSATTFKYVFDYHRPEVYWCTADVGWITGHTYVTYGPLLNGATSVMFEGIPTHPDPGRMWAVVEKYKVSKFYTAPTALRALMRYGDSHVKKHSRDSLTILGTVGEPINPEAWYWYYDVVGEKRCAIVDTFWQTETGGHVLTPLPGATPLKPGCATLPFFGISPAIVDENGRVLEGEAEGYLVFSRPWPGIMRTVYGDHQRFETTYFKKFPGFYCTGDGARRDADGYYWVTGRIDDMLNVSGHLLSTAEVESALVEHGSVAEAAVVSVPHPIKGECLYCFVTPVNGIDWDSPFQKQLKEKVREKIGAIATPDYLQYAPGLPKTRSGKIMRRILRKIARNDRDLGDISTLAEPTVVENLFENRVALMI
ncbi:unnamed protein product [Cyprideis torosa]|uniref:Acetyl-coenzyme A synthetase n=1 Tax=Cyprideis torosa TaxID=163714 RepID=A0A7R8ZJX4_9CRUS|nr:unnamed protein product [Cyprideis torosa]CAG0879133.1 unnamed protein product [Cyprideis torosa]